MGRLLSEIFDVGSVRFDLNCKTKKLALIELIDSISILNPECDRTELLAAIMER
jgi:hypothetical protein